MRNLLRILAGLVAIGVIVLPVVLAYTVGVYWLFRGKTRDEGGEGY